MTGPEHYRIAEQLLEDSVNESMSEDPHRHYEHSEDDLEAGVPSAYLVAAQVHATLALAAATARPTSDRDEWHEVTS